MAKKINVTDKCLSNSKLPDKLLPSTNGEKIVTPQISWCRELLQKLVNFNFYHCEETYFSKTLTFKHA